MASPGPQLFQNESLLPLIDPRAGTRMGFVLLKLTPCYCRINYRAVPWPFGFEGPLHLQSKVWLGQYLHTVL